MLEDETSGTAIIANVSFENLILNGTSTDSGGGSTSELEVDFDASSGNSK